MHGPFQTGPPINEADINLILSELRATQKQIEEGFTIINERINRLEKMHLLAHVAIVGDSFEEAEKKMMGTRKLHESPLFNSHEGVL